MAVADYRRAMIGASSSYRRFRWLLPSIGLVLGASLAVRGHVLLGLLVAGFAALRMAALFVLVRRRGGFGSAGGPALQLLRSLVRGAFEAAARAVGIEPDELRRELERGRSIAQVAEATGVAVDDVVDAVIRYASARIDALVAEGAVTRETASQAKERLPLWAARVVERRTGDRGRIPGRRAWQG